MAMNSSTKKLYTIYWLAVIAAFVLSALIRLLDPLLDSIVLLPDAGPKWYYWKLPQPNVWARITAWTGYGLHQIAVWFLIARSMKKRRDGAPIHRDNYIMLGVNLGFILLHLLQTHIWYDGLAQDVPIWTSQYSVIVMLVLVLLMLFPKRGAFWGKKIAVQRDIQVILRKIHGVYISWALIYTFWFHPMEGDTAILLGFFYMFLLMIQMSLFHTRVHTNLAWIGFLEFFVGIHGVAVALMNGQDAWTMFLFGFLFMTVVTQIHGLKIKRWSKLLIVAAYIGGMVAAYMYRGWQNIYEIVFIPSALYGGAFGLWLVAGVVFFALNRRRQPKH